MKKSIVVGAGAIGIATALYLVRSGRQVTLFDKQPPGEGTSSGNAGIISTGSLFPEATPGIWRDIPAMLLGDLAPVHIRPAYAARLLPWLVKFLASSSQDKFTSATAAISALSRNALKYYDPLIAEANAESLLARRGMYYVYESQENLRFAKSLREAANPAAEEHRILGQAELQRVEPALSANLAGAVYVPGAAFTISPLELSRKLFTHFIELGGVFKQEKISRFRIEHNRVEVVLGSEEFDLDELFVTCGAFSNELAVSLGKRVPLESERGYHLMLQQPNIQLQDAFLFTESAIAMTSMADGLRLAGTVEFAGLTAAPNDKRAWNLGKIARELIPDLEINEATPWMGHRPCLPDSVPVISRSPSLSNVFFGFGHGHLGLTHGAITGAMLLALADQQPPPVDTEPYRMDRRW